MTCSARFSLISTSKPFHSSTRISTIEPCAFSHGRAPSPTPRNRGHGISYAGAFAQPRKAFEGPVEYAWTFGLDPLFDRWVALALKGWELYDLDAPKDARRGVGNPGCLVHRPDDLRCGRDLLGVAVLAVHDDRLARNQGVDDVGGS